MNETPTTPVIEEPSFFDLHVHPSLKGGLSIDPGYYSPWREIKISQFKVLRLKIIVIFIIISIIALFFLIKWLLNKRPFGFDQFESYLISAITIVAGLLVWSLIGFALKLFYVIITFPSTKVDNLINSQATLKYIQKQHKVVVAAVIAMEQAFSQSVVYNMIGWLAPLDSKIMKKLRCGETDYHTLFKADLNHLVSAENITILKHVNDGEDGKLSIVLSVEGFHCFFGKDMSPFDNFAEFLKEYRIHHLTIAHLTQNKGAVHALGVRLKLWKFDTIKVSHFKPDSLNEGIDSTGWKAICMCYNRKQPILIDVKHMSFLSRLQFYKIRQNNDEWNKIPLLASHVGVTGRSFKESTISKIKRGKKDSDCDEVFWNNESTPSETDFNPWTINLFDEDILEIIKSRGMMGIIMDERVLGVGKVIGEFMSKKEVARLHLDKKIDKTDDTKPDLEGLETNIDCKKVMETEELVFSGLQKVGLTGDMILNFDWLEEKRLRRKMAQKGVTHIDYIACNIIHILKVGYKNGFGGRGENMGTNGIDVKDCICIGSDLDGIIDAANFHKGTRRRISDDDWIKLDQYDRLKKALITSFEECLSKDVYFKENDLGMKPDRFIDKVFSTNGWNFLQNNFKEPWIKDIL